MGLGRSGNMALHRSPRYPCAARCERSTVYPLGHGRAPADRLHRGRVDAALPPRAQAPGRRAQRRRHRARRHRFRPPGLLRLGHRDAAPRRAGRRRGARSTASTSRPCARRPGLASSPAATTTPSGWASWPTSRSAFPGYHARLPEDRRHAPPPPARRRVLHPGRRQVAPHAALAALGRRALRHLAARPRVRALLRVPPGRHEPLGAQPGVRQPLHRAAAPARGGLPPQRGPGRPGGAHGPGPAAGRAGQALLPVLRARRHARAAPRRARMGRSLPGPVRQGLGRLARGAVRTPGRVGHRARGHRAHAAARVGRRPGPTCRPTSAACSPASRRSSPGS